MAITLYFAVLAHLLADFIFQTGNMTAEKAALSPPAFIKHSLTAGCLNFIFLVYFGLFPAIIYSLAITLSHLLIDFAKNSLQPRLEKLSLLLLDQLFHVASIIIFWFLIYHPAPAREFFALTAEFFTAHSPWSGEQILFYLLIFLAAVFLGDVVIAAALEKIAPGIAVADRGDEDKGTAAEKDKKAADMVNEGKTTAEEVGGEIPAEGTGRTLSPINIRKTSRYIGIVERILVIVLVLLGEISAIAFIFTAKSVARFQKLDEKFASYYLFGTLLSLLIAILAGRLLLFLV